MARSKLDVHKLTLMGPGPLPHPLRRRRHCPFRSRTPSLPWPGPTPRCRASGAAGTSPSSGDPDAMAGAASRPPRSRGVPPRLADPARRVPPSARLKASALRTWSFFVARSPGPRLVGQATGARIRRSRLVRSRSFDCGRVRNSTMDHLSSGPPEIPYVRFSRVRLQPSGTWRFGAGPSAASSRSRLTQPCPDQTLRLLRAWTMPPTE